MLTVRRKRHRSHVPPAKLTKIQYSCYLLYWYNFQVASKQALQG
jgi:hypothetical protein